jgi:hypothetical protein
LKARFSVPVPIPGRRRDFALMPLISGAFSEVGCRRRDLAEIIPLLLAAPTGFQALSAIPVSGFRDFRLSASHLERTIKWH